MAQTLYEKLWQSHLVKTMGDDALLYIDRHFIHEVTSPQAFAGLEEKGRSVHAPQRTIATMDHSVSTRSLALDACGPVNAKQLTTLLENCNKHGVVLYPLGHKDQGIVHVIGPELGLVLPGMTVVCGDSHTATHGALGTLAFGIGTSEVEHVLATQTLRQSKSKTMRITIDGQLGRGVTPKDVILACIGELGHAGGTGYVIEYAGDVIRNMSMEGRMTVCNMSIEAGAKAGFIAPDDTTIRYLENTRHAPKGADWEQAVAYWQTLRSDDDAVFDKEIHIDGASIAPQVTWGTNPGQVAAITDTVPDPKSFTGIQQDAAQHALEYMHLKAGTPMASIAVSNVFIGSCTNSRIEDLREAAQVAKLGKVKSSVLAIVVPGSVKVKLQAEAEGLDKIFTAAGFEWRLPGCSMCLGMNDDVLKPGDRCASTSNRNFEGRQGRGAFTHLVSPAMAAGAAITGHLVDVRTLEGES